MFYNLNEILPADLCAGVDDGRRWQVPEWAFMPDAWTHAFLRGLKKAKLGDSVWEVGCGSGIVSFCLLSWNNRRGHTHYFSDVDFRCSELAGENIGNPAFWDAQIWAYGGKWDLLTQVRRGLYNQVDAVVACIPQVPAPMGLVLGEDDTLAHYYDPTGREGYWNSLGLGLNFALLGQAKGVLNSGGRVVLNLGGRPGIARLSEMFQSAGYLSRVLHEEVIPQHSGTSLATLASMEGGRHQDFEFFADVGARLSINARVAEVRRQQGLEVFHKIYVIEGTMA